MCTNLSRLIRLGDCNKYLLLFLITRDGKRAKATLSKTISTRNDQSKHCLSSDTINDSSSSYCSCDVLNFRRTKMRHKSRRAYSSSSSDSSVDRDSKSKDKMGSSSSKRDKEQVADSRKSQGLRTRSNSESSSHKATGGHLSKKRVINFF